MVGHSGHLGYNFGKRPECLNEYIVHHDEMKTHCCLSNAAD